MDKVDDVKSVKILKKQSRSIGNCFTKLVRDNAECRHGLNDIVIDAVEASIPKMKSEVKQTQLRSAIIERKKKELAKQEEET